MSLFALPLVALVFSGAALLGLRMVLDYYREARPSEAPPTASAEVVELRDKVARLESLVADIQVSRLRR